MASYLKLQLLLELAGNAGADQFRIREDPDGFLLLAVKAGAGAVQEVKLTQAEAGLLRQCLTALLIAKDKVPTSA